MAIASFLTACLTGMGVGSGGLFVVYLTMLCDMPQLAAQGLNLYFFLFSTGCAMAVHLRRKNLPLRRLAYICAVGSFACAGGATLAQSMEGNALRTVFAVVLIVTGAVSLLSSKKMKKTLYK